MLRKAFCYSTLTNALLRLAVGVLSLFAFSLTLSAQTVATPPATPTEAERVLAKQLASLPEGEAFKQIAVADQTSMTEGLYRALREIDIPIVNTEPKRALAVEHEAEAVAKRAGLPILATDAHFTSGTSTMNLGQLEEAIAIYEEARVLYKAANAPSSRVFSLYHTKAMAELRLGDIQASIEDNSQAIQIAHANGDFAAEGRALLGLGNDEQALSNFSEAETAFTQALKLFRDNKIAKGEAFVLNNLSVLHEHEGDYQLAIKFCEQSLAIKRTLGVDGHISSSLLNLANYYHMVGRDTDAIKALDESQASAKATNDNEGIAKVAAERGIILLETNHPDEALKQLLESFKLSEGFEDQEGRSQTLDKIAESYLELKDSQNGLLYAKQAIELAQQIGALEDISLAQRTLGQLYLLTGDLAEARKEFDAAVSTIELMRTKLAGGAEERQFFLSDRINAYKLLSSIAAMQKDWPAALEASEMAKGRTLLDQYNAGVGSDIADLSVEERAEENRLRSRYRSLDLQVDNLSSQHNFDPNRKVALNASLKEAKNNFLDFRNKLYENHPDLRLRRADLVTINLEQMQKLIPTSKTALLEYEFTDKGAYLYVVTRGSAESAVVRGYKLNASVKELARHVRHYRDQLSNRDPKFAAEAEWSYQVLLAPAGQQLKNATSLVVVPDGNLWQIPFESLERPDGHFLVESTSVTTVPSLSVLLALQSAPKSQHKPQSLLAFGNPGGQTHEQTEEAEELIKLYGSKSSEKYLGNEATLERFRQRAPAFDVVHIAAHGIFNDKSPLSSHMILAAANGSEQQGWLRADELQSLQLRANLVVLSGCETGKGSFKEGEGLVGMSWAALAAGSHATLTSSWRVEASSTTTLMLAFHRQLLNGNTRAESLRLAEVELLKTGRYSHPYYWAPFVLMGDGGR